MSERLVLLAIITAGLSGLPGLFLGRTATIGQWLATTLAGLGTGLGLGSIGWFWVTGEVRPMVLPWRLAGAELRVGMDGLSAIFLVPIFLISLLGSVYGLGYWRQTEHPENSRKLQLFSGTMTAGMALLVIARDSVLFLIGWEVMALSAFFLVTTEDDAAEIREAGWIYLVATHVATLCLFALFALIHVAAGSFSLEPLSQGALKPGMATAIFLLALVGFGFKAGIMPFHIWLPGAHAAAPSHISAVMSGVLIKMGIYGLVRVTSMLGIPPPSWGFALLVLGMISGILGVAFAIGQHDLKRLLAYHSIENIGIIVMGLGLASIGRSAGRADWVLLGLGGALLHVWNHGLFKSLLFLSTGSVVHATHTREIDQLGGLSRAMPWTSTSFLIGAIAICGLPPLNGFISEFLIYLGLFRTLGKELPQGFAGASFGAPVLAMIGGLAVACFVKVYGVAFLGLARSEAASSAHESPPIMLGPMILLAAACFLVGLAPLLVVPLLEGGVWAWAPELKGSSPALNTLAPLDRITVMSLVLTAGLVLGTVALRLRLRQGDVVRASTWGCGYLAPSARIQYTSSSFGQMLVWMFGWVLRPRTSQATRLTLFPRTARFHSEVPDVVLDEAVLPVFQLGARVFSWFRVFQRGNVQAYLLYIFLTLIAFLLWR